MLIKGGVRGSRKGGVRGSRREWSMEMQYNAMYKRYLLLRRSYYFVREACLIGNYTTIVRSILQ